MTTYQPLVSIGLPVRNGERYLPGAVESLIAQDYRKLELIISDNASTDATTDICLQYAARDERIRFQRMDTNIGAARNFNEVFEKAGGKYFMWAAHDDLFHPSYIRRCLEVLEGRPEVVLCGSKIKFVDEQGTVVRVRSRDFNELNTHSMDLRQRVRTLTEKVGWFSLYGLLRPEALRRTRLYTEAYGGDVLLLMELLFLGTTFVLPQSLYTCRMIPKSNEQYLEDITGSRSAPASFKDFTGLAEDLLRVIEAWSGPVSLKAALREDLLENVSQKNGFWSHAIFNENPGLARVPPYQRPVEIRALLAPETPVVELDMLRAAAHKAHKAALAAHPIRRFLERHVLWRFRWS